MQAITKAMGFKVKMQEDFTSMRARLEL
jgi:hypothetical protein